MIRGAARFSHLSANQIRHPKFFFHPQRHCLQKRAKARRRVIKISLEQSIEFQQRLVIEADKIQFVCSYARLLQAVTNGIYGKIVVVLEAGESFFLRRGDDLAINHEASGRVVIERRYAKNVRHGRNANWFVRKLTACVTLQSGRLEECVNEWRDGRTLGQHQQHAEQDKRDHNRRQPILLILSHELPELADYLCFRHPLLSNSRYHAAFARLSVTCDSIQE